MWLGSRVLKQFYDRTWKELAAAPGDPDGPDLPDLFHDAVEGLWPHDFEWMFLAGVLKDTVTTFEVYLEKGCSRGSGIPGPGSGVP